MPLVIAATLFWLRHTEVDRLRSRVLQSHGSVPSFALINEKGRTFGSAQLQGKIWIADFISTRDRGEGWIMSTRLAEMQKPLRHTDVHFVSITLDPAHDSPAILRDYAEKVKAQPERWDFLTGPKSVIADLARGGFQREDPARSTRMILVDRHGVIRGSYDALSADGITKILADANHLLREQPR